jgi:multiple sugar transport system substrate-binding protein
VKAFFLATLVGLGFLSCIAWWLTPPPPGGNRTPLVWVVDDNPVRQAQVDLFNHLNPDLYLSIDPSDNSLDKVIVQCSGGIGPDLITCGKPADLDALVHANIPSDVTDDLAKNGLDLKKIAWPISLGSCAYGGRAYGFPCNVYSMGIWFNKDNFDAANVPYPKPGWSWSDMLDAAKKLTRRDSQGKAQQFGFAFEWWAMDMFIAPFGGRTFSPDGTRCTLDSPGSRAGYQMAQDLMFRYGVAPTPGDQATLASQGGWGAGAMTYLMSGRAAMAFGARWWLNRMRQQPGLRLGVVPMPFASGHEVGGASRCALINRFSKHREAAIRFLKFLAGKPYNDLIIRQADGVPAIKAFCDSPLFLHDPDHPKEDFNKTWRDLQGLAVDASYSPFLRGGDLDVITAQTDLAENNLKPADAAMRQAALDATQLILQNARSREWLGQLYRKLTGRAP